MSYTPEIDRFKITHNVEDTHFEQWCVEELQYLENIGTESPYDLIVIKYVEALENLNVLK